MVSKVLIVIGVAIILVSTLGIAGGIVGSLRETQTNGGAGIGALGGSDFLFAMRSTVFFFVGLFIMIAGLIRRYLDKKEK
jgi:hypothetical protein